MRRFGSACFVLDSLSADDVIYRASEAPSGGPEVEIDTDGVCLAASLMAPPNGGMCMLAGTGFASKPPSAVRRRAMVVTSFSRRS
jgi:hypothetical protein